MNEKEVLEKALKDKKDNLILLNLDLYHLNKMNPDVKEKIEMYSKEIESQRAMGKNKDKERIIDLEEKMKQPKTVLAEIQGLRMVIKNAKKLIETLEECAKNPEKIYE